jgi:RNA polymerase sigma-70 factor (ECF subfamily)
MMTATNAVAIPLVLKWATTGGDVMVRAAGTDSELVGSAHRGEGEAIARLVERYSARLHRYLTRLTGAPTLAEDILQDTWLRVMDRLDHYNPARPFAVWLFRVAHNCAIDALRKQAREGLPLSAQEDAEGEPRELLELVPDGGPSALERLAQQELHDRVATVFAALPAHYREVLTLRFHEDLRLEEIAQVLGAPLSTVKTRVVRALALLRQRVETLGLNYG